MLLLPQPTPHLLAETLFGWVHARCTTDNVRGVHPEVMAAIVEANNPPSTPSYGADPLTAEACAAVRRWLGCSDAAVVAPVVSGIASDGLALAGLVPPTGAIYCHVESHINECVARHPS